MGPGTAAPVAGAERHRTKQRTIWRRDDLLGGAVISGSPVTGSPGTGSPAGAPLTRDDQSGGAVSGGAVSGGGERLQGVRDLRAGLAEAVRRAAAGERTVVTSGGRPVAQLGPLDADAPDLERLIGAGAVIPPRRTSPWRAPTPVAVWAGVRIDQVLRELRG